MKKFIIVILAFIISGCTNADNARRILEADGYTDIQMRGYDWFACSEDDMFHDKFTAIKGDYLVDGVVCGELWFKGSTIRVHKTRKAQ